MDTHRRAWKISEVLRAYFELDPWTQHEVQEDVQRCGDATATPADRARAEQRLARLLGSRGGNRDAGRALSRDERFDPALRELRARMDRREAAFGGTLARLMAERQLTQAQLAERIGVGQSAISMLLKRRCRPQRRTLGKLAAALDVPVETLWPGFNTGWRSGVM